MGAGPLLSWGHLHGSRVSGSISLGSTNFLRVRSTTYRNAVLRERIVAPCPVSTR